MECGFDEPATTDTQFTATTISYSYISTVDFAYAPTTVKDESSLVILADQNPRCTLGVTGVNGQTPFDMVANSSAKSLNHDEEGQVIARLDGSADWIEEPTGDGDDIYASTGTETEGRRGSRTDVFLIP